jgi:hypothetical protein
MGEVTIREATIEEEANHVERVITKYGGMQRFTYVNTEVTPFLWL